MLIGATSPRPRPISVHGPRPVWAFRPLPIAALLLAIVLVASLGAAPAAAAVGRVDVAGLDGLVVGQPGTVDLVAQAGDDVESDTTPLRLVLTISDEAGAADTSVAVTHDGTSLAFDEEARIVFPALDQPPLTIANQPDLASEEGLRVPVALTVPDTLTRVLRVSLMRSNELGAHVVRRAGGDRIGTAVAIAAATFPQGADTVYVARADEFADALAAGPAAGYGGAPILLTASSFLPDATAEELERLAPSRVIVLGGEAAVSQTVVDDIRARTTAEVLRLAGPDRFATAAAVALDGFDAPVGLVLIATGRGFADALSGSAAGANAGAPLLLVEPTSLPDATAEALRVLQPRQIAVLGGPGAVSDDVAGQLAAFAPQGVLRHAGPDRFATSAAIAEAMFDPADVDRLFVASGQDFPDALAGAPAAAKHGGPLLLTDPTTLPGVIADEVARQDAAAISVLGGTAAVSDDVVASLSVLSRDVEPDIGRFQESAASAPLSFAATDSQIPGGGGTAGPITVTQPTADNPLNPRPGDRFVVSLTSTVNGRYVVDYRVSGATDWQPFPNGTAQGTVAPGPVSIPLNAPLANGVLDLRITVTPATRQAIAPIVLLGVVRVNLTFPPPLISALVEDLADQSQLIAVRPVGGLEDGIRLDIDLGSAERAGADYPLTDHVEVLGGTGTAVLEVARDQVARIVYTAGPGDRVPGDNPTAHPLLTFRIDGIDTLDVNQSHVGQFFRYDIMHGVSRVFMIGSGPSIASPTVSNVPAGSGHTYQRLSFALRDPLAPFERVTIDLTDAELAAIDYVDAFAQLEGGDPHAPQGPSLGAVFLQVVPDESAVLTFVAGAGGVPTVQPEGPTIEVFIGGIAVADQAATMDVRFSRVDTQETASTTFTTDRLSLLDVSATDLNPDTADQTQTVAFTFDGAMSAGNGVEIQLPFNGADITYAGMTATVLSGNGSVYADSFGNQTYLSYSSDGDPTGTRVEIQINGIDTGPGDRSHLLRLYRYDSYAITSTVFNVGAGSVLAGVAVGDLPDGGTDLTQYLTFTPTTSLAPGETVTMDLSEGEVGLVDYDGAGPDYYVDGVADPGGLVLEVDPDVAATLTYTAGADGLPAGASVAIFLSPLSTQSGTESYGVSFVPSTGGSLTTSFRVRPEPGFSAATATDLAADQIGLEQVLTVTVSGEIAPGGVIYGSLSGAEEAGGRYSGARAVVTGGDATATLYAYTDYYAEVAITAGAGGIADGETITLALRGVNTDAVDETHAVDWYRTDSGGYIRTLFNIGAGSAFVGRPLISDLGINQVDAYQYFSASVVAALAPGDTVSFDLSAAQANGVDYRSAYVSISELGTVEVVADAVSAVATLTIGPDGVEPGASVWFELGGLAIGPSPGAHSVTVTAPTGTIDSVFNVFQGHGEG